MARCSTRCARCAGARIAVPGIHPSRVRGTSAEFTEYRAYRQGDDLRRIDWKLFARTDRAHVRISEERAVTPTMIVVDASASMAFPEDTLAKWSLARKLAIGLAAVAHGGGDPVGLMVAGRPRATLAPRTRRGIVSEAIRVLADVAPGGGALLTPAVAAAMRTATRIAIVSDFLGDLDDTLRAAREASAAGRDVYAIHLLAPEEIEPPAAISLVADPEDDATRRALGADTRPAYLRAFGAWRDETAARWHSSGSAYRPVIAGAEDVSATIRRIVTASA